MASETCEMDGVDEHHDNGHEVYWHCENPAVVTVIVTPGTGKPYTLKTCGKHAEGLVFDLGAAEFIYPQPGDRIWYMDGEVRKTATVTAHSGYGVIEWLPDGEKESDWLDADIFMEGVIDGDAGFLDEPRRRGPVIHAWILQALVKFDWR